MPGHFRRNCPMQSQGLAGQGSGNNVATRSSKKMQNKANVYEKMTLLGKEVPCLVDSGCHVSSEVTD